MSGENALACYLYCLVPSGPTIELAQAGLDARFPVCMEECGRVRAVVSEVELAEFCGDSGERNLQDIGWVGPQVLNHEAVVEDVMRQAPVFPVRFGTLFSSREVLRRSVLECDAEVERFLLQVGNQQEWAVKGQLNRAAALKALSASARSRAAQSVPESPGRRYFEEKRILAQADRDLAAQVKEFSRRAARELGALPDSFRQRKVAPPATAEAEEEMVLNWAFLLPPEELEGFRSTVVALNLKGARVAIRLQLTGPFPPYSFAPPLSPSPAQ